MSRSVAIAANFIAIVADDAMFAVVMPQPQIQAQPDTNRGNPMA